MPKGSRRIRPVKVVMVVGDPMPAPPRSAGSRVSRRAVSDLTNDLHERLQALYDEALKAAGRA
jgi:hypothetical protein